MAPQKASAIPLTGWQCSVPKDNKSPRPKPSTGARRQPSQRAVPSSIVHSTFPSSAGDASLSTEAVEKLAGPLLEEYLHIKVGRGIFTGRILIIVLEIVLILAAETQNVCYSPTTW